MDKFPYDLATYSNRIDIFIFLISSKFLLSIYLFFHVT